MSAISQGNSTNNLDISYAHITDEAGTKTIIDPIGPALPTIDLSHWRIHEGRRYVVSEFFSLAINGTRSTIINTDGAYPHMTFFISSFGELEIILYEGVTSTDGTTVTPINYNRASTNTSLVTIKSNATFTGGTDLFKKSIGGSINSSGSAVGGSDREFILKPNTKYAIYIISRTNANKITKEITWYEN